MQPFGVTRLDEPAPAGTTILDLLALEEIDRDLYRSTVHFGDENALYGGQVAAQALLAAGFTVAPDRVPHSLHGYFLRSGDAARPTIFRVERDRDGRSFSARRVVALQTGEVILNMSASFHVPDGGADHQVRSAPEVTGPEGLPGIELHRMFSIETRQPDPAEGPLPTRFWMRCGLDLPASPLLHACVLTYVSDTSSGLGLLPGALEQLGPTLDHSVWFHRPVRMDDWVLVELVPQSVAGLRGFYTGAMFDRDGVLVASLAQESLFRSRKSN
jgi:acyl-CoA thioesterase II